MSTSENCGIIRHITRCVGGPVPPHHRHKCLEKNLLLLFTYANRKVKKTAVIVSYRGWKIIHYKNKTESAVCDVSRNQLDTVGKCMH